MADIKINDQIKGRTINTPEYFQSSSFYLSKQLDESVSNE